MKLNIGVWFGVVFSFLSFGKAEQIGKGNAIYSKIVKPLQSRQASKE